MTKRILILSSNPKGTSALDLDREKREIGQALQGSEFIIESRGAIRPEDLLQALLEVKPQIVHFCGDVEGTEGIVLMDDAGNINFASTEALANLFKLFRDCIECVVLNACYSEVQADAIAEHINYVVGMNRSILDEAAITFAEGFYRAIGAGVSIKKAYSMGKVAIQFEYPDDAAIRRKLNPVHDDEDIVLPTPEYLVPVLKQKANPIAIKPSKPEEEPNFDKDSVESLPLQQMMPQSNPFLLRYPYLEFPQYSPINQRFSLYVQILIKSPDPEIIAMEIMEIEDTGISEKLPEVEIVLRARGFDIEGTNTRVIQIERDDDTEERFVLIPRQLGEQQIRVDFYQNGKRIGTARRNIIIYAEEDSETIEISQTQEQTTLELKDQLLVPPPDLEICVELDRHDNRTIYFTLHSTKSEIDYHHTKVGQVTLETSPEEKIRSVYQELGHLAESLSRKGTPVDLDTSPSNFQDDRRIAEERLVSVGNQLWDELITDKLKQEYWKFKDRVNSLLITSDEPWIPWEMIKPYDLDEELEDPFWCEQFALSRWLSGPGTADEFPTELVVTVAPDSSNLPNVKKEVDFLQHLNSLNARISSIPTISNGLELKDYIKNNPFSILHFACHGMFDRNLPNDSAIQLTGDSLRPSDIKIKFKDIRPIIFINACHGGRVGFSFTKIGGWAEKFINARVGVFIGAMWEVNDELAYQFAETFYTALLKDNLTVAEAFQKSRQAIRDLAPYNSTWLAYSLYADPEARIQKDSIKSQIGHSDLTIRAIAFSPDGKYLVSGSNDRTVRLWDLQTGQLIRLFKGHKKRVKCIQISEDGKLIISGSADSTVKIWELATGNCLRTIKTSPHPRTILNAIAINSDLSTIATGSTSRQGTIKLWNGQTGEMIDAVKAASSGIRSLTMSQDGKILVSGSAGNTVKIWHLNSGLDETYRVIPYAHLSDVLSLAIHKQILVSGGEDRTIKLWNLETAEKQQPHILRGHAGSIWCIAISPNGSKIASASGDYTVKIWDIKTGKLLETLTGHLGEVRTVAFSPDGQMLASAGDDWEIKLWQLDD